MKFRNSEGHLAPPQTGSGNRGGGESLYRRLSNQETSYTTPMPHLREAQSDLGWLGDDPFSEGPNNDNAPVRAGTLYDELSGVERVAIQGLGLENNFEALQRTIFHSHSAPGSGLRVGSGSRHDTSSTEALQTISRKAASHLGLAPNSEDQGHGSDHDEGVLLEDGEDLRPSKLDPRSKLLQFLTFRFFFFRAFKPDRQHCPRL